jgi:hypothetical protein
MDIEGAEYSIFADPIPWLGLIDNLAMEVHSEAGNPAVVIECLREHGFDTTWSNDYGFPVDMENAAYIYASRNGQLRN